MIGMPLRTKPQFINKNQVANLDIGHIVNYSTLYAQCHIVH